MPSTTSSRARVHRSFLLNLSVARPIKQPCVESIAAPSVVGQNQLIYAPNQTGQPFCALPADSLLSASVSMGQRRT